MAGGGGRHAPQQDVAKFREVYLHLVSALRESPQAGEGSVHVLLYFIDFDHYELHERQLMGLEYVRGPEGPLAVLLGQWVAEMEREGLLQPRRGAGGLHLPASGLEPNLSEAERGHVDAVLARLSQLTDFGSEQLCALARRDLPWIGARPGEALSYAGALFRQPATSVRP